MKDFFHQSRREDLEAKRRPIFVPDEQELIKHDPNVEENNFLYPPEYEGHLEGVMLRSTDIFKRVDELADLIAHDYHGKHPMIVCVLKGASIFYNSLLVSLSRHRQGYSMEFIRARSYGMQDTTSGNVEISGMDLTKVRDRHVLLVEDVVDTGTTMSQVIPVLNAAGCISLQVCTLLDKRILPQRRRLKRVQYTGFSIPDHFVVGHGLDFAELYRECLDLWVLSQLGKDLKGRIPLLPL